MSGRLNDKIALVTGAGSGIGLATARRLTDEGALVVAGILEEAQRTAVAGFDPLILDVRSEADWDRAMRHVEAEHRGLDVLVNNAGIHRPGTAESTPAELWAEIMAVNLWGTFLGCKKAIPLLRQRGGGSIVNLASIAAIRGVPGSLAYSASKGGVHALTLALAADHVADQIRVNCLCPGAVETPIIEQIVRASPSATQRALLAARHPMGRLAQPEEIVAVVAFLASDDASFMTGLAVPVDGGRSAR